MKYAVEMVGVMIRMSSFMKISKDTQKLLREDIHTDSNEIS